MGSGISVALPPEPTPTKSAFSMALIECPECGGQVSDRAPACPHCGVPIADGTRGGPTSAAAGSAAEHSGQISAPSAAHPSSQSSAEALAATPAEVVEPLRFRLAGRPIPVAGILFWGGMVVGIIIKFLAPLEPDAEPELWRRIPWLMIWAGVLWFAVTEFGALIRNRLSKR
jgi:hypothetical protein